MIFILVVLYFKTARQQRGGYYDNDEYDDEYDDNDEYDAVPKYKNTNNPSGRGTGTATRDSGNDDNYVTPEFPSNVDEEEEEEEDDGGDDTQNRFTPMLNEQLCFI